MKHEIKRSPKVWKEVSINYMIKLLKNNEKDLILIIKNQNSKMIHFKTIKKKKKVSEIWQNYWNYTWKLYELSTKIRTDKKTVFMNK